MSIPRILCLAIGALLIPGGAVTAATVTYDTATPNRPVSVVGIDINSILYDVTFTYNNNAATNPLRVGSLPDTDIPLAITGLADLLNTQSVDSYYTVLVLLPNVDLITPPTGSFEYHGFVQTGGVGPGPLEESEGPSLPSTENGEESTRADTGFLQTGGVGSGSLEGWDGSSLASTENGEGSTRTDTGFAQFTPFAQFIPSIVPEPSAIAGCLGLVGMGLIAWRRKSNRKKK
jgi:hypothetical protein